MNLIVKDSIDIMILNGGGPQVLMRLFKSMEKHVSDKYSFRVFVRSQGLRDGSHEYLKDCLKYGRIEASPIVPFSFFGMGSQLFVEFGDRNIPGAWAYNQLLDMVWEQPEKSKYILNLDDDTCFKDDECIKVLIDTLEEHKETAIATCLDCVPNRDSIDKDGFVLESMSAIWLMHRTLIDEIGYFDERMLWHFTDSQYCRAARSLGYKIRVNKEDLISHEHQVATRRMGGIDLYLRDLTGERFKEYSKMTDAEIKAGLPNKVRCGDIFKFI